MVIINSLLAIHLDSIRTNDILGDDNYRTDQSSTAEAKDEVKENNEDIEVEKPAPRDKIPPTWRIAKDPSRDNILGDIRKGVSTRS